MSCSASARSSRGVSAGVRGDVIGIRRIRRNRGCARRRTRRGACIVRAMQLPPLARDAEEMCAHLLRIDTTNPPGNERPAAAYLAGKLREVGYDVTVLE